MKRHPKTTRHLGLVAATALAPLLYAASAQAAAVFNYDPITDPIVSATFSMDVAAMTAHRTVGGETVNYVKLLEMSPGGQDLCLADALFGTAAWPDPPQVDQGLLETGWISAGIAPSFFPALTSGSVAINALLTDTHDAMFAIDFLMLSIETTIETIESYYGWPIGNENNGFGIGLFDGQDLSDVLPGGLLNVTDTGFDEVIGSKIMVPEPASLLLLGLGLLALPRRRTPRPEPPPEEPRGRRSGKAVYTAAALLVACSLSAAPALAEDVLAGSDLFVTPGGGTTYDDVHLPADFFGPGSDPFDGTVQLKGAPLTGNGLSPEPDATDTIVERLEDAILPDPFTSSDTVDTEMLALRLVSVEPITITFNGGTAESSTYDVEVCLSSVEPQPLGSMTINHECERGGTITSVTKVIYRASFTKVSGSEGEDTVSLDPAPDWLEFGATGCWAHEYGPLGLFESPGGMVDHDCDGTADVAFPPTSNFFLGVCWIPCDDLTWPEEQEVQKEELTEEEQLRAHGILPPRQKPDQVHLVCPMNPNEIEVGGNGAITATVQFEFEPVADWEVLFEQVAGDGQVTFIESEVTTDSDGQATATFLAASEGQVVVKVEVLDLRAYCVFYIVPPPPPTGACCVDALCAATNTQAQCDAMGGTSWIEGETCPEHECPVMLGDLDGDGDVDLVDFATFALCFGQSEPVRGECVGCDLDTDGNIDLSDFATFALNFGS